MPLGDIAVEIVGRVIQFIVQVFIEIVVELLLKGPGYMICRLFSKRVEPDGLIVLIVGLAAWLVVGAGVYALYRSVSA